MSTDPEPPSSQEQSTEAEARTEPKGTKTENEIGIAEAPVADEPNTFTPPQNLSNENVIEVDFGDPQPELSVAEPECLAYRLVEDGALPNCGVPELVARQAQILVAEIEAVDLLIVACPLYAGAILAEAIRLRLNSAHILMEVEDGPGMRFPNSAIRALEQAELNLAEKIIFIHVDANNIVNDLVSLQRLARVAHQRQVKICLAFEGSGRNDLGIGVQYISAPKIDWVGVFFEFQSRDHSVPKSVTENAAEIVRRAIDERPDQTERIARSLEKALLKPDKTAYLKIVDEIVNRERDTQDKEILTLLNDGWDAPLCRLLICLLVLSRGDPEGPRIETIYNFGADLLGDLTLHRPIAMEEDATIENGIETQITRRSKILEISARRYWSAEFDTLLRKCKVIVERKSFRQEDGTGEYHESQTLALSRAWVDMASESLLRLYPQSLISIGQSIKRAYPTSSDGHVDQGSMVRSVSYMLLNLSQIHPTQFSFKTLWEETLATLEEQEQDDPSGNNVYRRMYRAFPATRLLFSFWSLHRETERGAAILKMAMDQVTSNIKRRRNYEVCHPSVFALLYLTQDKDYPIEDVTFMLLEPLGGGTKLQVLAEAFFRTYGDRGATPADRALKLFRDNLKFLMRDDINIRIRLLTGHRQKRLKIGPGHYYFELLRARIAYDALFQDFPEIHDISRDTIGGRIFEGKTEDADTLFRAFWEARIDLIQFTTAPNNQHEFFKHAARILSSGYQQYGPDAVQKPPLGQVVGLLEKAFHQHLFRRLQEANEEIQAYWKEDNLSALLSAVSDTLEGRRSDDVAIQLYTVAQLVRSIAVAEWPFLVLPRYGKEFDRASAETYILAFLKRLTVNLDARFLKTLESHWKDARDVLNIARQIAPMEFELRDEQVLFEKWAKNKSDFLGYFRRMLIESVQTTDVAAGE
jgi:hypothetical protein